VRRWGLFGLTLACVVGAAVVRADPPADRTVRYQIRRNGDPIGSHVVTYQRSGERHTIEHRIRIRVTVLALEAYAYSMDSHETWDGDRLLGLRATTDRNGEGLTTFARISGEQIRIRGAEGRVTAPAHAVPSSPQHWVFDRPRPVMIDAEDGDVLNVRTSAPATETLELGGEPVECRRVTVSGDLDATLWYAPSDILVRKRLTAPDGSTILTVLM